MVLPYCIIESESSAALPSAGVRGARIETFSCGPLQCLVSRHAALENVSRQDALAFHAVVESVFHQVAVVPFRFPTLLASEAELEAHLKSHHETYAGDLHRFRHLVQMELHIAAKNTEPTGGGSGSGTGYLQERSQSTRALASAAQDARQRLGELVREWQQVAPLTAGQPSLRCYALVARSEVQGFREKLLSHSMPVGITMALSGPWPATAFMSGVVPGIAAPP